MAASQALSSKMSTSIRLLLRQPASVAAFTRIARQPFVVNEKPRIAGKNSGELSFFGQGVWPALHHHQQFVVLETAGRNHSKVDSDVDDDDAGDYKDSDVDDSDDDFDDTVSGDDLFDSDKDSFSD